MTPVGHIGSNTGKKGSEEDGGVLQELAVPASVPPRQHGQYSSSRADWHATTRSPSRHTVYDEKAHWSETASSESHTVRLQV